MSIPMINRTEPLPGYKLMERLGSGGFGEVWKCEAPGGILKAIKFVYGDMEATGDEGALAEREHKALERIKQVRHPFILSLERYDIIDGRLVILTELADCNLWDRFREYRNQGKSGIPRDELLRYLHEAAEALDMMNDEHQLQHLDIKPQNLFLVHKHIKVADFGMAKVFEGLRATITGGVTPVYAAPETFEGWISRHCDQYSLAIVYQELLTGVRPFNGANTKQLLLQHLSSPPNVSPLPECDRPIISRALAKKADERFPNCLALIEALQEAQRTPPPPQPMSIASTHFVPEQPATPVAKGNGVLPPRPRTPFPAPIHQHENGQAAQPLSSTPTERSGAGALQPTLVIGLGWLGGRVLRRFSAAAIERFGEWAKIPCMKLLAIDTDANAIQALIKDRSAPLDAKCTMTVKLERATHYGRRDIGAGIEKWLPNGLLFRIPRVPATNGVRAYGRLALLDHWKNVFQRLKSDLQAVTSPAALADSERTTNLGLRSNRPRIVIVSGLAGGAGSGMFIDLAYLAREALRQLGYEKLEVTGVLLVPDSGAKPQALSNACATLTEIAALSREDSTYTLSVGTREPSIVDRESPLTRIVALPMQSGGEGRSGHAAVGQSAGWLLGETLSPLGRAVDAARSAATQLTTAGPVCQVAASYRFAWPRRRLVRRAAGDWTERLLRLWTMKDTTFVRPAVAEWLDEQWANRQLQPEMLIERLQQTCAAAIGQQPDAKFDALVDPLANRAALGSKLDAYSACTVLDSVFELVGKPLQKGQIEPTPGLLQRTLGELAASIASEFDKKLAELAVHFIEQPGPRLAAAEEAIRQLIERLQGLVQTYENLYLTLERDVIEVFKKLFPIVGQLDTGALGTRKSTLAAEILELLRAYPKKRYQAMIASFALSTYRGMLGAAPEFLREVNYCRERLAEVALMAEQAAANDAGSGSGLGPGCDLFPGGHANVRDAARALATEMSDDELRQFDESVQQQIRKQFHSLVGYCLELGGHPGPLLELIEEQAHQWIGRRLDASSAADVFFEHFQGDEQAAHRVIAGAVSEALPEMATRRGADGILMVMAAPDGPVSDRLVALAEQAADDRRLIRVASSDDVIFYCERGAVPLTELPPLSPAGRDAYEKALAGDAPPHARTDIKWSLPGR